MTMSASDSNVGALFDVLTSDVDVICLRVCTTEYWNGVSKLYTSHRIKRVTISLKICQT